MHKYVIKRLLSLIPVLFIVSIVIFMLIHLVPGDPAAMMLGEQATPAQIEALRETLGLNEPLVLQYIHWVRDIFRGDLGTSLFMDGTMLEIISTHMVPTLQQTVVAILFATLVGVPLGMLAALVWFCFFPLSWAGFPPPAIRKSPLMDGGRTSAI